MTIMSVFALFGLGEEIVEVDFPSCFDGARDVEIVTHENTSFEANSDEALPKTASDCEINFRNFDGDWETISYTIDAEGDKIIGDDGDISMEFLDYHFVYEPNVKHCAFKDSSDEWVALPLGEVDDDGDIIVNSGNIKDKFLGSKVIFDDKIHAIKADISAGVVLAESLIPSTEDATHMFYVDGMNVKMKNFKGDFVTIAENSLFLGKNFYKLV